MRSSSSRSLRNRLKSVQAELNRHQEQIEREQAHLAAAAILHEEMAERIQNALSMADRAHERANAVTELADDPGHSSATALPRKPR